jgi:hypothetical protein
MAKHKASRKPLPPQAKEWLRQADVAVRFIERLRATPSIHGIKWTSNMVEHYAQQYFAFRQVAPQGCKKQANALDVRVNIVMAWKDGLA